MQKINKPPLFAKFSKITIACITTKFPLENKYKLNII